MTLPHRFHIVALTALILGSLIAGRADAQDVACHHPFPSGVEAAA